jgi:ribosome-binding protein aMBF1 (putative translation factor)
VKRALEIMDEKEQLLILQKGIATFIKEAEYTLDIVESVKQIYEEELMKKLTKELMIPKVNRYRLNLIREFIKRRISSKAASKIMGDYFGYLKKMRNSF